MAIKDISGQKFGFLTAIEFAGIRNHKAYWKRRCECGNEIDVLTASLISGNTKSCGCYVKELVHQNQFKDLTNQKFGKLLVKGIHHKEGKNYYWECMCDCGNIAIVDGGSLRRGTF